MDVTLLPQPTRQSAPSLVQPSRCWTPWTSNYSTPIRDLSVQPDTLSPGAEQQYVFRGQGQTVQALSAQSTVQEEYIDIVRDEIDRTNVYLTVTVNNHAYQPIFFSIGNRA